MYRIKARICFMPSYCTQHHQLLLYLNDVTLTRTAPCPWRPPTLTNRLAPLPNTFCLHKVDNDIKIRQTCGPAPAPAATLPLAETAASSPPRQCREKRVLTATTNKADSGGGSSSDSDQEYPAGIVGDHWPHPPCDLGAEVGGSGANRVVTKPGGASKRPQRATLW